MSFKNSVKRIYNLIPGKRVFFTLLKTVWSPPERVFRHLYFNRIFHVKVDSIHAFNIVHHGFQIENEIFWKGIEGGWEKDSISLWIKLSKSATTIFDVGANTGIYSLVSQAVNLNARIFSFEPVDRVFRKLTQNVLINNYTIQCVPLAVSNKTGQAIIYDTPDEHVLSVTVNKNLHPHKQLSYRRL